MEEEKIYQEIRKSFYNNFNKNVLPILKKFENKRRKIKRNLLIFMLLVNVPILFIIFKIIFDKTADLGLKNFAPIILFLLIFAICLYSFAFTKAWFENLIKKEVMPIFCTCFSNLRWETIANFRGICLAVSNDTIKETNLIPDFEKISYGDCFNGEHNRVKFSIEEGMALDNSGRNSRIVFIGAIVTIEMNKNFNGNTIIQSDSTRHVSPSKNLHHTILEDIEYEKKFDVFTDDDVEARYLITTSFMERIKSIQLAFKVKNVSVAFYQDKIFIALHAGRDLFSLGSLLKDVCATEQFDKMLEEILSIIKLIDHFKLDQKIGM